MMEKNEKNYGGVGINSETKSNVCLLQKQLSINKGIMGQFGAHNNNCSGTKSDEIIEVIESGNCQPTHPKVLNILYINRILLKSILYNEIVWDLSKL